MLSFKHVMNLLFCALKVQENKLIIKNISRYKAQLQLLGSFKGCFE